jgi:hypothetical protein
VKRRELERLLDHLVKVVPRAVKDAGLPANACILSSRMGVEALRSKGVRARPLPVRLRVYNSLYAKALMAGEEGQVVDGQRLAEAGGWCVVVGESGPDATGWDGHLVVIVEERYLLDLSAGQVQRLHKDIHAEAYWVEARRLARGIPVVLSGDDGCCWLYFPDPDNKAFLSAPAWAGYLVTVRGDQVVSRRTAVRPDVPVAPEVTVTL